MLVIAGGVVRSGSVVLYQYIRELVTHYAGGVAPLLPEGQENTYFDEHINKWTHSKVPYVLKLHSWRDSLGPMRGPSFKVVMSYRDLRDTCLSVRDFRNDHFEGVIASHILQRIRDAEENWRKKMGNQLLPVEYRTMRTMPAYTIKQISHFLNIEVSEAQAQHIAEKWSIHANRARADKKLHYTDWEYMSQRHISSGNVDRWRRELTEEQCRIVQEHVGVEWFYDRGYEVVL